jgi:hypothetical protein
VIITENDSSYIMATCCFCRCSKAGGPLAQAPSRYVCCLTLASLHFCMVTSPACRHTSTDACTYQRRRTAGLPSVTEDAEGAAAPPPPVAQLISPQPQAVSPAVPAANASLPVPALKSCADAAHAAPGAVRQVADAAPAAGSGHTVDSLPISILPPAAAIPQPPPYWPPTAQSQSQAHCSVPAAAQNSPEAVAQPADAVLVTPIPAKVSPLQRQAATPAAATPQPQQPGQSATSNTPLAAADASTPQQVPLSPALSDASTVSIGRRPASRSVLPGSCDSNGSHPQVSKVIQHSTGGDGFADPAATPAAAAAAVTPAEQEPSDSTANRTAPRFALGTMMERAWSAAGKFFAVPTVKLVSCTDPDLLCLLDMAAAGASSKTDGA